MLSNYKLEVENTEKLKEDINSAFTEINAELEKDDNLIASDLFDVDKKIEELKTSRKKWASGKVKPTTVANRTPNAWVNIIDLSFLPFTPSVIFAIPPVEYIAPPILLSGGLLGIHHFNSSIMNYITFTNKYGYIYSRSAESEEKIRFKELYKEGVFSNIKQFVISYGNSTYINNAKTDGNMIFDWYAFE